MCMALVPTITTLELLSKKDTDMYKVKECFADTFKVINNAIAESNGARMEKRFTSNVKTIMQQ